jgi:hypothetical protein
MGMVEMEQAIEVMLQKAEKTADPFASFVWQDMHPSEFMQESASLVGLCQLLANDWMTTFYPNSRFFVSQKLVERMREREVWKGMPDAPTTGERVERMTSFMRGGK